MDNNFKQVSIIIPTYRDWARLSVCLKALSCQSYPEERIEILVINNDPKDLPPTDFKISENCRILTEGKSGSYAARNLGIKVSQGEILAFTDSDCIPDQAWVENAVSYLKKNPDVSRIGGQIELFFQSDKLRAAEVFEKVYAFKQDRSVRLRGTCVTGNMIAYKHIFNTIGLFNENLLSGGDHEWSLRAEFQGYKISYCKDVIVKHPARVKIVELIKKEKRIAGGSTSAIRKRGRFKQIVLFIKSFKPPIKHVSEFLKAYGNDLSRTEKLKVLFVKYLLSICASFEQIKISFGKSALRE